MIATGTNSRSFGPLAWLRRRLVRLLYDSFSFCMLRDRSWQAPFIDSVAAAENDRIIAFGSGSALTVITLAVRYPRANLVAAEPDERAARRARRRILQQHLSNVTVIEATPCARLPFDAGSFDKAVCLLGFHDRLPAEKLGMAKEMVRVLRHGGTLHVADYDKPQIAGEGGVLQFTGFITGRAAAESHYTGDWTAFLAKAGFSGIRRRSSHSVGIGRVSIVKAQKRLS